MRCFHFRHSWVDVETFGKVVIQACEVCHKLRFRFR